MTLETKHLNLLYFVSVQIGPYENYENYEIKQKTKNILNLHCICIFSQIHIIIELNFISGPI